MSMIAYRIADGRYPLLDGIGASLRGGRWNSPGRGVVYAAETYAGAVLEVLVHMSGAGIPKTQKVSRITIDGEVAVETLEPESLAGWDVRGKTVSRQFGDRWLEEGRSVALRVPSVVLQGREFNILLNPVHAEMKRIIVSEPEPVIWDPRLFRGE